MKGRLVTAILLSFSGACMCFAQAAHINPAAQRFIALGNQAWIIGMKTGNVGGIAATYTADALDCGPTGECDRGRAAIESAMKARIARMGKAITASVTSSGAVQRGNFVYEWGSATASFPNRQKIGGPYLTVWQLERDGSWKIFRNMALPLSTPK